jgi:hypothetical protein
LTWERSFELGPRNEAFSILLHEHDLEEGLDFLLGDPGRLQKQKPWNVRSVIMDNEETWAQAKEMQILSGAIELTTADPFVPMDRLWQPDSMVETVLLPLLQTHQSSNNSSNDYFEIWDLGAGAGRDTCFLAEQLLMHNNSTVNNYQVVAVDQRYWDNHLDAVTQFWKRRRVDHVASCLRMDLNDVDSVLRAMQVRPVRCIFAVRFWNRLLVETICSEASVGTIVAISQFGKAAVGAQWEFEHPNEKHVLERNELQDMFQSPAWSIVHDQVVKDTDHGRTLIQFVAQRVS